LFVGRKKDKQLFADVLAKCCKSLEETVSVLLEPGGATPQGPWTLTPTKSENSLKRPGYLSSLQVLLISDRALPCTCSCVSRLGSGLLCYATVWSGGTCCIHLKVVPKF